jgi:MFS family permease
MNTRIPARGTAAGPRTGSRPGPAVLRAAQHLAGPLADRDFALFCGGQSISKLGNGVYQVGLAWSVYRLTGSTAVMGLILAMSAIPQLALVLFGGAAADRLPRRTVILVADTTAALVTLGLAAAASTRQLSVPMIASGALLLGTISAFYGPAYSALNRDMLPESDLSAGNALLASGTNLARALGPVLAGVIYAIAGATTVFAFDAGTFGLAAVAMLATRVPASSGPARDRAPGRASALLRDAAAGLRYTFGSPRLMLILMISAIANFACIAPYLVLLPGLVRSNHETIGVLGFLNATQITACIAASMLVGWAGTRLRPVPALLGLAGLIGAGTVIAGTGAADFLALGAGAALIGTGFAFDVIENTILQRSVPSELLSRVYSINMLVSFCLLPAGYTAAGFLARSAGIPAVLTSGGAILIAACVIAAMVAATRQRAMALAP